MGNGELPSYGVDGRPLLLFCFDTYKSAEKLLRNFRKFDIMCVGKIMYNELTAVDIKKMKAELKERINEKRPILADDVKEARSLGDLSENAEYRSARRAFFRNESRIRFLEKMIKTAKIIEVVSAPDEVGLFDRIVVQYEDTGDTEELMISTTTRLDLNKGIISKESPFGKAILGKKVGDRVFVKVNEDVSYYVVIKSITKGEDDESIPLNGF
jgi:transcription elongation factor GreA